MPADSRFARSNKRVETNNRIFLGMTAEQPTATYDAVLADVWYYYADSHNRYVKVPKDASRQDLERLGVVGQRVTLKWQLDDSEIALKDDVPVKFGDRSLYAARCRAIVQNGPMQDIAQIALEQSIGAKCEIDVESQWTTPSDEAKPGYWWSSVKEVRSRERVKARPPAQQPATPSAPAPSAPARVAPPRAAEPVPQPLQDPARESVDYEKVVDELLAAVPFPAAQSVRALAKWANLSPGRLAAMMGGVPITEDRIPELKEKIKSVKVA
jgi:hypothetical protein